MPPLNFSRYFQDYTGNDEGELTKWIGRGANTAARKRLDMRAMQNITLGLEFGANGAHAPDSWYRSMNADGSEKFKKLVADVYYNRPLDPNSNWRIRRGNRGWVPSEYKEWFHLYSNIKIVEENNGSYMIPIRGDGPEDMYNNYNNRAPRIENNNYNRPNIDLNIKANRPSGWYNTSGHLKTINRNVITSPISMSPINLKNLDKLYLDQNSGSRYLYTLDEIKKIKVNPMTRGNMKPRLLPNNIKSAIKNYVKGNAATRIQAVVRGRQAISLARAKASAKAKADKRQNDIMARRAAKAAATKMLRAAKTKALKNAKAANKLTRAEALKKAK